MISLEQVSLRLGEEKDKVEILNNISIKFETGKMYVITGPNGGGKTSVAKVLMGIYQPWKGKVWLNGKDITGLSICERAKAGIRYAFQNPPRFKGIDIKWFLKLASPETDEAKLLSIMRKIGLCPEDYLDRMTDSGLSGGEMKRVEIASVLLGNTSVAILDEPEAGVDLWSFEQLLNLITRTHRMAPDRTTIIISHNEKFLEAADEIIVMANGQIQERGNIEMIRPLIEFGINCQWRKICMGDLSDEATKCTR